MVAAFSTEKSAEAGSCTPKIRTKGHCTWGVTLEVHPLQHSPHWCYPTLPWNCLILRPRRTSSAVTLCMHWYWQSSWHLQPNMRRGREREQSSATQRDTQERKSCERSPTLQDARGNSTSRATSRATAITACIRSVEGTI